MLKWKKQLSAANCGQIALSVITGKSLKEIYSIVGHSQGTRTKDLVKVLIKLGYKCPSKLQRLKEKPKLAIAKLNHRLRKFSWHWVVIAGDKIYDGIYGTKHGNVKWKQGYRITSYLPIR